MRWQEVIKGWKLASCKETAWDRSVLIPLVLSTPENERLLFSHNRLSSLDADDLDGLESLQFLSLEGNSLRNLAPYAFHRTPNLKVLRLSNNPLKFIDATWFRNLDVLESLEVRSIDAHSITNNAFSLATRLESIDLSDNDFVDIPRGLGSARNLKILRMDQNPLVKLDSSSMSGVRRLRELYLSQMPQLEVIEDGVAVGVERYVDGVVKAHRSA
ncbi:hypothetical protein HPB47_016032 [Ixodes persulcatus]|uniref:Uncharacterized protein n=1 Tax=Ixodes persulcatus TaxID=34615 RepID=A0AC60QTY5_IXOPE|nr:hypothetical protein HPB47_016032 [Ixodes persulcatus]